MKFMFGTVMFTSPTKIKSRWRFDIIYRLLSFWVNKNLLAGIFVACYNIVDNVELWYEKKTSPSKMCMFASKSLTARLSTYKCYDVDFVRTRHFPPCRLMYHVGVVFWYYFRNCTSNIYVWNDFHSQTEYFHRWT